MVKEFDAIPLDLSHKKPKVGIVGEIYIKYASLGNNHLEDFLVSQDAEVNVPGLYGFLLYTVYNTIYDYEIYGKNVLKFEGYFVYDRALYALQERYHKKEEIDFE